MSRFKSFLRQYPLLRIFTPRTYSVDVGSSTTRIAVDGKILYQQPTWVVVHPGSGTVVEMGKRAAQMVGKVPPHLSVLSPLARGYISDQLVFEWYARALLQKITPQTWWYGPLWQSSIHIAIPSETPEVEKELWLKTWQQLGFGKVVLVEKKKALQAWANESQPSKEGHMKLVIDSGAGSTEVVVISGSEVLIAKTVPVGGQDISQSIIKTVLKEYACEIGSSTAEKMKTNIKGQESIKSTVRGKNVLTGLPTTVVIDNQVIIEAAMKVLKPIGQAIKESMAKLPADSLPQADQVSVILAGGNGLFWGFDLYLESLLKVAITKSQKPGDEVIKGLLQTT